MAKSITYLNKIERCRETSATGFRIKQAMYNALRACHAEGIEFPHQAALEKHCIPGKDGYLEDKRYYLLTEHGFAESERTMSEREIAFRTLAEKTGGKVVFTPEREPVLMVNGWLLRGGPVHEDSKFTEEYEEDFSVPYALYPRVINILEDGSWLIEESPGVCVLDCPK